MNKQQAIDIISDMLSRGESVTPLMMYMLQQGFKFSEQEAKEIIEIARQKSGVSEKPLLSNVIIGALGGGLLGSVGGYGLSKDSPIRDTLIGTGVGSVLGGLLGRAYD